MKNMKFVSGALFVSLALHLGVVAADESSEDNSTYTPPDAETWHKQRLERLPKFPILEPDDVVSVYYLEHVLASWVLDAAPWNAYHSGLGFAVDDAKTGEEKGEYTLDFVPRQSGQVQYQLVPVLEPVAPEWTDDWPMVKELYAYVMGSYNFTWENEGGLFAYSNWPQKFTNATLVGKTDGKTINKFREWVVEYAEKKVTFEPIEVVVEGNEDLGLDSLMCHDLFSSALHELHRLGFQPNPQNLIFRDHIVLYADSYEKVDMNSWWERRQVARYFRLFSSFMDSINEEFTSIRGMLVNADILGVQTIVYKNGEYYRVNMKTPFVNYCYMGISMPPMVSRLWSSEKACALGEEVHANQTMTFLKELRPSHALFVFDHLVDSPKVWAITAFLMMASFSVLKR